MILSEGIQEPFLLEDYVFKPDVSCELMSHTHTTSTAHAHIVNKLINLNQ